MSSTFNPYAAPKANLQPFSEGGCWRDGDVVVVTREGDLPPRCVKCNAPAGTPIKARTLYWHHPALYVIALFALLIYLIVAVIVRKKAVLSPGLCPVHQRRRTLGLLLGWLSPIAGVVLLIMGGSSDYCSVMVVGGLLIMGGLIAGVVLARILYPERIDDAFVRLKGAGPAFLDSLPPFHG
jgi:hypothetical protein